jgi:hypothetical protein
MWQTDVMYQCTDHNPSAFENCVLEMCLLVWCACCYMSATSFTIIHTDSSVLKCAHFVLFWSAHTILPHSADSSHHSCKLRLADALLLQTHSLDSEIELPPVPFAWTTVLVKSPCLTSSDHHTCSAKWCKLRIISGCTANTISITPVITILCAL